MHCFLGKRWTLFGDPRPTHGTFAKKITWFEHCGTFSSGRATLHVTLVSIGTSGLMFNNTPSFGKVVMQIMFHFLGRVGNEGNVRSTQCPC